MKTGHEAPHAVDAPAEQSRRCDDVPTQPRQFGDCIVCLLPLTDHFLGPHCSGQSIGCCGARTASVLFDRHLAKALGLGMTQFCKRKKAGDFRRFELTPQLPDSWTRYSGSLVQRWLDGEAITGVPVVAGRRFFGKARAEQLVAVGRVNHAPQSRRVDGRTKGESASR